MAYRQRRHIEFSTLDYFTTVINQDWNDITVVKSFLDAYKSPLPVICISLTEPDSKRLQLGSNTLLTDYTIVFEIFATSNGQRLDLSEYLLDKIKDGWVYNTYILGSANTLEETAAGRVNMLTIIEDTAIDFSEDVDKYDKYRWVIKVKVRVGKT